MISKKRLHEDTTIKVVHKIVLRVITTIQGNRVKTRDIGRGIILGAGKSAIYQWIFHN